MKTNRRIEWLDIAKAFGIMMVVYGHSHGPHSKYVYLFHMPLFIFLSGYLFKENESFKSTVIKKTKTLYLPFLWVNTLVIGLRMVALCIEKHDISFGLLQWRIKNWIQVVLLVGKDGNYLGATWFMASLFAIAIFYKLLEQIFSNVKYKNYILLFSSAIVMLIGYFICLPERQSRTFILVFFYAVGHYISRKLRAFDVKKEKYLYVFIIPATYLFFYIGRRIKVDMGTNTYSNFPAFLICAFLGIFVTIQISKMIAECSILEKLRKPLIFIGKNSVDILIWHMIAFRLVVIYQLWREGNPIQMVFEVDSRYNTAGYNWILYFMIAMIASLLWGQILRKGPWNSFLKKIHFL